MDDIIVNCEEEFRKLVDLQYDCEWNGDTDKAEIYKIRAEHYKKLIDEGILYEPKF